MKKIIVLILALALVLVLFAGCDGAADLPGNGADPQTQTILPVEEGEPVQLPVEEGTLPTEDAAEPAEEALEPPEEYAGQDDELELDEEPEEPPAEEAPPEETSPEEPPAEEPEEPAVTEDGSYTSPEDVALYIHLFGRLPDNFITKNEARDLGWVSSEGNLWDVAPGMSIGGDRFGNYEGLLPEGSYRECDVNYAGGFRGGERLIYGSDGSVWYTNDHYESFTQLY